MTVLRWPLELLPDLYQLVAFDSSAHFNLECGHPIPCKWDASILVSCDVDRIPRDMSQAYCKRVQSRKRARPYVTIRN